MTLRYLIAATIVAFAVLPGPASAQEQQYPWCTQGSAIHCYYSTREQCEEAVDYHGFCIANPDLQSQGSRVPPRARQ